MGPGSLLAPETRDELASLVTVREAIGRDARELRARRTALETRAQRGLPYITLAVVLLIASAYVYRRVAHREPPRVNLREDRSSGYTSSQRAAGSAVGTWGRERRGKAPSSLLDRAGSPTINTR